MCDSYHECDYNQDGKRPSAQMKVGLYLPDLDPESLSAPEKCLWSIQSCFADCDSIETVIIGHGSSANQLSVPYLSVSKLPLLAERQINAANFDLVHFNRVVDRRLPSLLNAKTVLSYHGDLHWELPELFNSRFFPLLFRTFDRFKLRQYDLVHFVSHDLADRTTQRNFGIQRACVIHNGVDLNHYRPVDVIEIQDIYNLPQSYILHISNYGPKKNSRRLLKGYAEAVPPHGPDLVICGGGWQTNEAVAQLLLEANLLDRVHLLGFVPEEDLPSLYTGAQVTVYPSLHESFGLPILESLACGTPIVTSNRYSMPEVAGAHGVFCDPKDSSQIGTAIERARTQQFDSDAFRDWAEQFSWDRAACGVHAAYHDLTE